MPALGLLDDRKKAIEHDSNTFTLYDKVKFFLLGAFFISFVPYLHIGIIYRLILVPDKPPINRSTCSCSCFDTVFREHFESPGPSVGYKHLYFNATLETLKMWTLTVVFFLMAYESIRYLCILFKKGHIRNLMFLLYLVDIYPHYYSWWCFVSYYNDAIYKFFYNHLCFMVSEIIVTITVLYLCNSQTPVTHRKLLLIISITSMHILTSAFNQAFSHLILGEGSSAQNSRNLGLLIPDVVHIIVSFHFMFKYSTTWKQLKYVYCKDIVLSIVAIVCGTIIGCVI